MSVPLLNQLVLANRRLLETPHLFSSRCSTIEQRQWSPMQTATFYWWHPHSWGAYEWDLNHHHFIGVGRCQFSNVIHYHCNEVSRWRKDVNVVNIHVIGDWVAAQTGLQLCSRSEQCFRATKCRTGSLYLRSAGNIERLLHGDRLVSLTCFVCYVRFTLCLCHSGTSSGMCSVDIQDTLSSWFSGLCQRSVLLELLRLAVFRRIF